ncbi:MAG: ATP synthase subunit I [Wenzhouxiangella sp.]
MTDQTAPDVVFARAIAWLMRVQAGLIVVVGVVFFLIGGMSAALAALGGGAAGLFLTALSGLRVALSQGSESRQMVRTFYRAMALKFALTMLLFIVVAIWLPAFFGPVVSGYVVTVIAYWLAMRKVFSTQVS